MFTLGLFSRRASGVVFHIMQILLQQMRHWHLREIPNSTVWKARSQVKCVVCSVPSLFLEGRLQVDIARDSPATMDNSTTDVCTLLVGAGP